MAERLNGKELKYDCKIERKRLKNMTERLNGKGLNMTVRLKGKG